MPTCGSWVDRAVRRDRRRIRAPNFWPRRWPRSRATFRRSKRRASTCWTRRVSPCAKLTAVSRQSRSGACGLTPMTPCNRSCIHSVVSGRGPIRARRRPFDDLWDGNTLLGVRSMKPRPRKPATRSVTAADPLKRRGLLIGAGAAGAAALAVIGQRRVSAGRADRRRRGRKKPGVDAAGGLPAHPARAALLRNRPRLIAGERIDEPQARWRTSCALHAQANARACVRAASALGDSSPTA